MEKIALTATANIQAKALVVTASHFPNNFFNNLIAFC